MKPSSLHRIVIAGGGAGGLELAVRLGRRLGPDWVTLVDVNPFHVWKPSLHEVAAGTLDIHREGLSYAMLAHDNGFRFVMGALTGVDRPSRTITVGALLDQEGEAILPRRSFSYDTLVLAVGSFGHFFDTPGAEAHAISLDTTGSAERFRAELLKAMARADTARLSDPSVRLNVVIVGGGATGVELAAELHEAGRMLSSYGLPRFDPASELSIALIEGGPRILAPLPERVSQAAHDLLTARGIEVRTHCRVTRVEKHAVVADGTVFPADLCVWAAGIKASPLLAGLGLPVNRLNQVEVDGWLRTEDPAIYAMGDCAAAPWGEEGRSVPARAQAAHQQATYLARQLVARARGEAGPGPRFVFRDFGSLVSIGHSEGVGSLMGVLSGGSLRVEGWIARMMYAWSHWTHYAAVLGVWGAAMRSLGRLLMRRSRPRVKLH